MAKTFNQKLNSPGDLPKVEDMTDNPKYVERYKATSMLIAAPMQYNDIMARVPRGNIVTTDAIRARLAAEASAGVTCPLTAGIFINIVAGAAIERGDGDFPWWRTVKAKGELCEKFPGGIEEQALRLGAEGVEVIVKGKKCFVKEPERYLWAIEP